MIGCDFLFFWSIIKYLQLEKNEKIVATLLIFLQYSNILVDNIHFQYNSFLQGILIFAIKNIENKKFLRGAFLFTVLLNFKHIYLYVAGAFFFYLISAYCFNKKKLLISNFIKLGCVVISVFFISFAPFLE